MYSKRRIKMNEKTIRQPTGPAIIFLINALTYFFTIFSTILMGELFEHSQNLPLNSIILPLIWGATNLFMSIVLFAKKYNNALIVGLITVAVPCIIGLFINITPYNISEILFSLIVIGFAFIMIKKPETPIREKAVKLRFVIPVFKFVLILISTIQTISSLFKNIVEATGAPLSDPLILATVLLPSLLGAIVSFLPVLCYAWLANWLADPYKK